MSQHGTGKHRSVFMRAFHRVAVRLLIWRYRLAEERRP